MYVVCFRSLDQLAQERTGQPATVEISVDVHRVFHRVPVAALDPPLPVRRVSGHPPVDLGRQDGVSGGDPSFEPGRAVGEIDLFFVPDGGGVGDRIVVDVENLG